MVADAIVGREAELAAVERFLAGVPSAPAGLVIEGEPGIGKTTVWADGVRRARELGYRVLEARPAESEAKLSYAALADLVGEVFDATAAALPPVQERALAAALLRADPDETATARTTGTALVNVLAALAKDGPVVVALDDVQWLDPASEQALAFAGRRLPARVGLLVATRPAADRSLLRALAHPPDAHRVEHVKLGPLSLAGIHHLVRTRVGSTPPRPLLLRVAAASGGNPFFALEIAHALASVDRAADDPLPVPASVEQIVAGRFAGLSDAAREAALAAAALARPRAATVAAALDADASAALLEAEEAGVLTGGRDRISFTHPLLASAIYASAGPERRRRLHERLAAVAADDEERARHRALAATGPDEDAAADLERAAERAATRGAPDAAAELYEAARRLTPPDDADAATRRGLGEASALLTAGDAGAARSLAEPATTSSTASLRARAFALLGDIVWVSGDGIPTEHFEAALAAAPDDRAVAARVYPKLVGFVAPHDPARALAHADAAIGVLSPERDPGPLSSVIFGRLWCAAALGHAWDANLHERWRELEARAGPDVPKTMIALIYLTNIDDVEGVRARHAAEDRWFRDRGEELWCAERLVFAAQAELRAGRWDVAEQYADRACEELAQVDNAGPLAVALRTRSFVDAHRGRTARARETLTPLIDRAARDGLAFWEAGGLNLLALVEFADGDHAAVDRVTTRMGETLDRIGTREYLPDRCGPFHVESLLALGDVGRARAEVERLEERGRVFPRLWIDVTLPRARALVLAADGDVEAGARRLRPGRPGRRRRRLPFEHAWNRLVQGRLHRRAKQKRAAADAFTEAAGIFERLGAPTWLEQARAELARVGLRRAPTELTATERRVAELAAQGMTNREVAAVGVHEPEDRRGEPGARVPQARNRVACGARRPHGRRT